MADSQRSVHRESAFQRGKEKGRGFIIIIIAYLHLCLYLLDAVFHY